MSTACGLPGGGTLRRPASTASGEGQDRTRGLVVGVWAVVIKVLDLVGTSRESWQQAAENAVREAARTVAHITGVEVANMTADVEGGQITSFNANVRVAFAVDANRQRD